MAVGAHQGVGQGDGLATHGFGPHHPAQVFQVHLVTDAHARRHHAEVVEGLLPPAQEGVAFAVAFELAGDVVVIGLLGAVLVHHHRVVDHQVHRREGVDAAGVTVQPTHGVPHGGQIHHRRHAGEVLHQDPGWAKGHLVIGAAALLPGGQGLEVVHGHRLAVLVAQQVFHQHLEGEGQPGEVPQAFRRGGQTVIGHGLAADGEGAAGVQTVLSNARHQRSP